MQFKAFRQFENQIGNLTQDRQKRSETVYDQGIQALIRAKESHFQDRSAILEATQKFIAALRFNRQNPQSYIALGYLLMLTGDHVRAHRYLSEAIKLEPENQTAQDFLVALQDVKKVSLNAEESIRLAERNLNTQNQETLAENLENLIITTVQNLMREPHRPNPSHQEAEINAMKTKLTELKGVWERLQNQIKMMDELVETASFYLYIRPIETLIRRYQTAIRHSESYLLILQEIAQCKTISFRMMQQHSSQINLDQSLEQLLDACDRIADQLDTLHAQKLSIEALEPSYQELIRYVSLLQEQMDERI